MNTTGSYLVLGEYHYVPVSCSNDDLLVYFDMQSLHSMAHKSKVGQWKYWDVSLSHVEVSSGYIHSLCYYY